MSAATNLIPSDHLEDPLEDLSAQDRIRHALNAHGDGLILTTSFGIQSSVLLHMATEIKPDIPVVFVDNGRWVPETYQYAQTLTERLGLNLHVYRPRLSAAWDEAIHGRRWEQGEEALKEYRKERKLEPMARAIKELGATAWISGARREQTQNRQAKPVREGDGQFMKYYPIIDWSARDIHQYMQDHNLPNHPLWEKGFSRVGETWETVDPSKQKQECGLHDGAIDFQI